MEEIAGRIELYHNLFAGCLAVSLLCLILASVLFFVLDIRNVLGYLTGRQRRKKVKEMGVRQMPTPGVRKVEQVVEETLPNDAETTLLTDESGTTLLSKDGSTAVLNQKAVRGQFLIEREIILIHTEEVI